MSECCALLPAEVIFGEGALALLRQHSLHGMGHLGHHIGRFSKQNGPCVLQGLELILTCRQTEAVGTAVERQSQTMPGQRCLVGTVLLPLHQLFYCCQLISNTTLLLAFPPHANCRPHNKRTKNGKLQRPNPGCTLPSDTICCYEKLEIDFLSSIPQVA